LNPSLLWIFAVLTAPLFAGVIFKVKAFFGGKKVHRC
jgi:hypothetical protein